VFTYGQPAFFGELAIMLWLLIKGAKPPVPTHLNGLSNQRFMLAARGRRLAGNGVFLSAAAAGRSLSAIR
jgi:hypothetical protein